MKRSRTLVLVFLTVAVALTSGVAVADHGPGIYDDCKDTNDGCFLRNISITDVHDADGDGYASAFTIEMDVAYWENFDNDEDDVYVRIYGVGVSESGIEQHGLLYEKRIRESVRRNLEPHEETEHLELNLSVSDWNGDPFLIPTKLDQLRVEFNEEDPRAVIVESHHVEFDPIQRFEKGADDTSRTVRFEVNDASGTPISESANPTVSMRDGHRWESLPMDGSVSVFDIPVDWRTRWGERPIRFSADGYETALHDLSTKMDNGYVEARLERARKPVVVDANVADASVYDESGTYLGTTPYSTQRDVGSPLTLSVEKPGYMNDTVTVDPGDSASAYLIAKTTESVDTVDGTDDALVDTDLPTWNFDLDPALLDAVSSIVSAEVSVAPHTTVSSGETVTFDTEGSYSLSGNITEITVQTGDGRTYTTGPYSPRVQHVYTQPGTYTARVVVSDDNGDQANTTRQLVVENVPPTPRFDLDAGPSSDGPIGSGQSVLFDASNSTDYEGTLQYDWTFGDGTSSTGRLASHTYDSPGIYAVTLRVTDSAGATESLSRRVEVIEPNDAPTPAIEIETNGRTVTVDATGSTDDGTIDAYGWSMGDGTSLTGTTQTHTYDQPGEYTVELRVVDDDGAVERVTENVTVERIDDRQATRTERTEQPDAEQTDEQPDRSSTTDEPTSAASTVAETVDEETVTGFGPGFDVTTVLLAGCVLAIVGFVRLRRS